MRTISCSRAQFDKAAADTVAAVAFLIERITGHEPEGPFYLVVGAVGDEPLYNLPYLEDYDTDEDQFVRAVVKFVQARVVGEHLLGPVDDELSDSGYSPYDLAHLQIRTVLRTGVGTHQLLADNANGTPGAEPLEEGDVRTPGGEMVYVPALGGKLAIGAAGWGPLASMLAARCFGPALECALGHSVEASGNSALLRGNGPFRVIEVNAAEQDPS